MAKKTSTLKLGIFIFLGITLFVLAVFLLGGKDSLFSGTFNVKAYFTDIQGLRSGATVRLSGIDVGKVDNVALIDQSDGKVEVTLQLRSDIKGYITTSTIASIETEGLVGNKVVVLSLGEVPGEAIADNGVIKSKEAVGFAAIIAETQGIMGYLKIMTQDLGEIIGRVNRGEGSIGKLLVDEELYNDASSLTKRADESLVKITDQLEEVTGLFRTLGTGVDTVLNDINSVVNNIDSVIVGIKQGKGVLGAVLVDGSSYDSLFRETIRNVELTTADARLAASRLAENMEALKHNWLFKSYFENRGYWDKAQFEDDIDSRMKELDQRIKVLDERIETLKSLKPGGSK